MFDTWRRYDDMKASDLIIGAAIVAVGFIVYQATRPPAPTPPPTSSSSSALGALLTPVGAMLATRLNEALDGEREWW